MVIVSGSNLYLDLNYFLPQFDIIKLAELVVPFLEPRVMIRFVYSLQDCYIQCEVSRLLDSGCSRGGFLNMDHLVFTIYKLLYLRKLRFLSFLTLWVSIVYCS